MIEVQSLLALASKVHSAAITGVAWPVWRNYERQECQEAFRTAAISMGVRDKTAEMGFVITKCLSLSGFGS